MFHLTVEDDSTLAVLRGALLARGYEIDAGAGPELQVRAIAVDATRTAVATGESHYRKLFDYAPDGILIADRQSYYLDANPAMCRMLDYTRDELVGLHASDIVAPAEVANIEPALHAIKSAGDYSRLWTLRRKDHSTFPADVMVTTLPDGTFMAVIRDISDQVAADKRIRELNRTYSVLSDVNQLIVRERESQAIIERACRIAVEKGGFLLAWIGLKRDDSLKLAAHAGATPDTLDIVRAIVENPAAGCAFTARALDTGLYASCNDIENDPLSQSWRTPALERGYRAMASFPLIVNGVCVGTYNLYAHRVDFFDADEVRLLEELAGDISFALSVSERERQRRELERQLTQAQKLQAIGTLAGGIAHDFNNVLTAITGNAELARAELPESHAAATSLAEIERAAKRAKELAQRILTFSRPQEPKLQPILLAPVLDEVVKLMLATLPAGVELLVRVDADLPAVRADESQMHQLLLNLLTNAWHALPARSGRIEVALTPCRVDSTLCQRNRNLSPGQYVRLTVADNGMGMSDATVQRIFDPFFTTKPPGEGTGLGLSMVHGIVRDHQGAIIVDSTPNAGSTFHIFLPTCTELPAQAAVDRHAELASHGNGERILYIDDEESLVFLSVRYLERMGYRVAGFTDPAQAVEAFRAAPDDFDIVITDNNMPIMTGIDVAAEILRLRPHMPLLLTSGYMRPEETDAARALGIRHIALKPDSAVQFAPLIEQLLDGRGNESHETS